MRRKAEGTPPRVDTPSQHQDRDTRGPLVLIGGACTPDGEALGSFIELARETGGPIVGIAVAIVAFLLVNWFFTEPLHTLDVSDPESAPA